MFNGYWQKPAALHQRTSRVYAPGEPVLVTGPMVASGTLGEMIDRWGALPPAERLHHVVLIGGGSLSDLTLQAMLARDRSTES